MGTLARQPFLPRWRASLPAWRGAAGQRCAVGPVPEADASAGQRRGAQVELYRQAFECAAELGEKKQRAGQRSGRGAAAGAILRSRGRAAEFGLGVNVEFVATPQLLSLRDALRLVTRPNRPNSGIMVDTLRLMRSGSTSPNWPPPSRAGSAALSSASGCRPASRSASRSRCNRSRTAAWDRWNAPGWRLKRRAE